MLKDGDLPTPLLVHAGMYITQGEKGSVLNGFTCGLRRFGKEEIEVVGTSAQPAELFGFLVSIAEYVISEDVELKDGETIGFSDDEKLPIALSDAVSIDGESLKIGFKNLQ